MIELKNSKFTNVFFINDKICTRNLNPGEKVYGETLTVIKEIEYRFWDPYRSKLAAMILNGCSILPITPKNNILYLGAGNGTTASHVSDIVTEGYVYCVEFSARAFKDLMSVASSRKNLLPILENAFHPERYKSLVGNIDVIYQDISQRDQARVFITNSEQFLKSGGYGIFMIKSRSIDITKPPRIVFTDVVEQLRKSGFKIIDKIGLEPYSKDHLGVIVKII